MKKPLCVGKLILNLKVMNDNGNIDMDAQEGTNGNMGAGSARRDNLAKAMYEEHRKRNDLCLEMEVM